MAVVRDLAYALLSQCIKEKNMIEKDVEYAIKNLILSVNSKNLSITNEFSTDGIIRYDGAPISIMEFKIKRNLENDKTLAQIYCQAMCYYCKLIEKEEVNYSKPFYIIIGDDNEISLINIHKMPNNWLRNPKWTSIAPSRACKEDDLMELATSMLTIVPPIYFKYEDVKELSFGFHLLFTDVLI